MRSDGSHPQLLNAPPATSPLPSEDLSPTWSPNGGEIAFEQKRAHRSLQIYVVNADGSGLHQLTQDGASLFPGWSPDGRRIVVDRYVPTKHGSNFTVATYVMDTNGGHQQLLTSRMNLGAPLWSPDGRMIAFAGDQLAVTSIQCG
jgi:TolB protein